jgi:hypothetical protein
VPLLPLLEYSPLNGTAWKGSVGSGKSSQSSPWAGTMKAFQTGAA